MDNMTIYNQSRDVPQEAQKQFSNGTFSGTDINPMWRIKKLTELFGPCGIGWYYEVTSERAEEHHDMTMAIVDLNLYIKVDGEWSKPIYGTGGNALVKSTKSGPKASDEGYKMALTDALSVACKALGIGADIWYSADANVNADYSSKYSDRYEDDDGVALQGSAEAAKKAGEKKLEELNAKAEEARQKAAQTRGKATQIQIEYIKQHADDETYVKAMEAFGAELEKMTAAQADKLIARIKANG